MRNNTPSSPVLQVRRLLLLIVVASLQADSNELRSALGVLLTSAEREALELRFVAASSLPAAAIVTVSGQELRIERDYFDGLWTIATNEADPRLITRVDGAGLRRLLHCEP